jgi:hypothetical protein
VSAVAALNAFGRGARPGRTLVTGDGWGAAAPPVCRLRAWKKGEVVKARWIGFGEIELDGKRYGYDVVIDRGEIARRRKKPSKAYRDRFGHTPLSADEELPLNGARLVVGTGAYGSLPVMAEVREKARRRGVELVTAPTEEALRMLDGANGRDVCAVIHVTC